MHKWETTSFSVVYWPFSFLSILLNTQLNRFLKGVPLQMWAYRFQSSVDTNPRCNIILFKRDHLPQRHTNEHSNPAGMSLQVLTENCFIAQKGQECNKSFWGFLILLTFTILPVNLIWLCKATWHRGWFRMPPAVCLCGSHDTSETILAAWQKWSCICWVLGIIKLY